MAVRRRNLNLRRYRTTIPRFRLSAWEMAIWWSLLTTFRRQWRRVSRETMHDGPCP